MNSHCMLRAGVHPANRLEKEEHGSFLQLRLNEDLEKLDLQYKDQRRKVINKYSSMVRSFKTKSKYQAARAAYNGQRLHSGISQAEEDRLGRTCKNLEKRLKDLQKSKDKELENLEQEYKNKRAAEKKQQNESFPTITTDDLLTEAELNVLSTNRDSEYTALRGFFARQLKK